MKSFKLLLPILAVMLMAMQCENELLTKEVPFEIPVTYTIELPAQEMETDILMYDSQIVDDVPSELKEFKDRIKDSEITDLEFEITSWTGEGDGSDCYASNITPTISVNDSNNVRLVKSAFILTNNVNLRDLKGVTYLNDANIQVGGNITEDLKAIIDGNRVFTAIAIYDYSNTSGAPYTANLTITLKGKMTVGL